MERMNKINRVKRTLRCLKTDQAPIFDGIRNDKIIEHFGGGFPEVDDPKSLGYILKAHNEYCDAIKSFVKLPMKVQTGEDHTGCTIWPCSGVVKLPKKVGVRVEAKRWTSWTVDDEEYNYDKTSKKAYEIIKSLCEADENIKYENEKELIEFEALCKRVPDIVPFHCLPNTGAGLQFSYLMLGGLDHFSYLNCDNEDLVCSLLEACYQHTLKRIEHLPVDYNPIAVMEAEDIAYKTGSIFSPTYMRKNLFPRLKKIFDYYIERDIPVIFHSDGDIREILPDIIQLGISGIHPIEVQASMNVKELREKYPKLVLIGGVDCGQLLPYGMPEEVYNAVRQVIIDSKGYGYFPGSSSEINNEVPLENAIAFKEAVESF